MEQLKFFKGEEEDLLKKTDIEAGAIYYCTDTKNTYLGTGQNELILYSSAVGKATNEIGGEIFNDYVNNVAKEGAHAEGESTKAEGRFSHVEGYGNVTEQSAAYAHAEGDENSATGYASHVEGKKNLASSEYQHVQGKYNVEDTENKYAHIVGGGTEGARKNIHTVDWDGNAWFAGKVYIGGANQNDTNVQPIVAAADLKPILLDDQMATTYLTDFTYGDKALDAILKGRQILITTPSVGGIYTKSFSPVYMYQLPNKENEFLYLFYLTDEKNSLDLSAIGLGVIYLPKYAQLKMKLSKQYNECPLQ